MDNNRARQLLEARRTDLGKIARVTTEQGDIIVEQRESPGDIATDLTERASDTLEREVDVSIREAAEDSLRLVDAALERVSDGTYGTCARCGESIPDERLEARPEAEYCVEHQPATAA